MNINENEELVNGLTVDEQIDECEDMARAERANEYAQEGVTSYEEGSYLEKSREDSRFWVQVSEVMDRNPRF